MKATPTLCAHVESIDFWSARLPGWELARGVMNGTRAPLDLPQSRPAPTLLAPTERRRAPDTVALAVEVALQACLSAKRAPADLAAVFASTYGDLAISDYLCAILAKTPAHLSPTKFHHSVHNAAAGYWTIGAKSHRPYTAISAYEYTFAAGLLEAIAQVLCDDRPVLYVAYDIEACGPMATMVSSRGLFATAMVLSTEAAPGRAKVAACVLGSTPSTPSRSAAAAAVSGNALANALPFFEGLAAAGEQMIDLPLGHDQTLRIALSTHS